MGGGGVSYNVRPYYADYYIQIRATNVVCTVSMHGTSTIVFISVPLSAPFVKNRAGAGKG